MLFTLSSHNFIVRLRKKFLPPSTRFTADGLPLRTLVLDLDETLVYSRWKPSEGWKTVVRPGMPQEHRYGFLLTIKDRSGNFFGANEQLV
jgi:hypothetical protein